MIFSRNWGSTICHLFFEEVTQFYHHFVCWQHNIVSTSSDAIRNIYGNDDSFCNVQVNNNNNDTNKLIQISHYKKMCSVFVLIVCWLLFYLVTSMFQSIDWITLLFWENHIHKIDNMQYKINLLMAIPWTKDNIKNNTQTVRFNCHVKQNLKWKHLFHSIWLYLHLSVSQIWFCFYFLFCTMTNLLLNQIVTILHRKRKQKQKGNSKEDKNK